MLSLTILGYEDSEIRSRKALGGIKGMAEQTRTRKNRSLPELTKALQRLNEREARVQAQRARLNKLARNARTRMLVELGAVFAKEFPNLNTSAQQQWENRLLKGLEGDKLKRRQEIIEWLKNQRKEA